MEAAPNGWMKLDNSAKIYPAVTSRRWAAVFRVSVNLTVPVKPELLQQALDILIDECPIVPISYTYLKIGMSERIRDFDCVTWGTYYKDMKLK